MIQQKEPVMVRYAELTEKGEIVFDEVTKASENIEKKLREGE